MGKPIVLSIGNLNLDIYMKIGNLPGIDEAVDAFEATWEAEGQPPISRCK